MVQWVKCSPCTCEDLGLEPQYPCKSKEKQHASVAQCWEWDGQRGRFLKLTSQPIAETVSSRLNKTHCLKRKRERTGERHLVSTSDFYVPLLGQPPPSTHT